MTYRIYPNILRKGFPNSSSEKWYHPIIKYKVKHVLEGIFVATEDHAYDHNPFTPMFSDHIYFLILAIGMRSGIPRVGGV